MVELLFACLVGFRSFLLCLLVLWDAFGSVVCGIKNVILGWMKTNLHQILCDNNESGIRFIPNLYIIRERGNIMALFFHRTKLFRFNTSSPDAVADVMPRVPTSIAACKFNTTGSLL